MSKYELLAHFFSERSEDSITLAFGRINEIIGSELPRSANDHRSWWANRHDGRDAQNLGWQAAGWEVKDVDMQRKSVTFFRVGKKRLHFTEVPKMQSLTIDEAKQGLAAHFGVDAAAISITINA